MTISIYIGYTVSYCVEQFQFQFMLISFRKVLVIPYVLNYPT